MAQAHAIPAGGPEDGGPPGQSKVPGLPPIHRSLSSKLLVLTILFVMLAEVFIYLPSIARYRLEYLNERLAQCHLALLTLQATNDGMVDKGLQMELLDHAGAFGMTAREPYQGTLTLGPDLSDQVDARFDLRRNMVPQMIIDALAALVRQDDRLLAIRGWSPKNSDVLIEAYISEAELRMEMRDFSWRILLLSLAISGMSGALVFLALHWLIVRPMRRLALNMTTFREAPQDPRRVLHPSDRGDEIGRAELALRELQDGLRRALSQRDRLAGVGTAMAKITHDLKGILTTALLESDRLEQAADPEIRHVTQGIAQAVDRAVGLCGDTLRYAKEGPPEATLVRIHPASIAREAALAADTEVAITLPDATVAWADKAQVFRIFSNLFVNAKQAGATEIRVKPIGSAGGDDSVVGTEGAAVAIDIADNGPGLPKKAQDNLFQAFSGSARAGGTGLGLAISRELAGAQGGDLQLVTTGAGGTVFRLVLQSWSDDVAHWPTAPVSQRGTGDHNSAFDPSI